MSPELLETTFALLRLSLDAESLDSFLNRIKEHPLSKEDWAAIYDFCKKQTIIGVVLVGVNKLPEDLRPPREILDHWICQGFYIHQQNIKMNAMCAKVTKMFSDRGLRSVILKGQANARLYPDPFSRQCGDIDILVEGGKKNVIRHLKEMGLMEGADISLHHIHVNSKFFYGISVEVHFKAVNCMPFGKGRRLLKFLEQESSFDKSQVVSEGFYVPSMEFALMMQMSHIRHHFICQGIGLRQLVDYFLLLKNCEQETLTKSKENVEKYGLKSASKALMWCLELGFRLEESLRLSDVDEKWGEKFQRSMLECGNFGKYDPKISDVHLDNWKRNRKRFAKFIGFDLAESIWFEISYWFAFVHYTPERIRQRKFSLRK